MRDMTPSCPEPAFEPAPLKMARQVVLPEWIDYNGHMNVAYYTLAFDHAFDDLLENWLGIGVSFVERSRLGPMALQGQNCYLSELMEGEPFHVEVLLLDCDPKKMHFFGSMISDRTGALAATYEAVSMCVDLDARKSAPYPDWAFGRLEAMRKAQAELERPPQVGRPLGIARKRPA
ncbi:MAG: thioesterase family protein [Pseudomonadota bacterium]